MTNQPGKLTPAAPQSDRPCIKSEAYGVSAQQCGCPKCAPAAQHLETCAACNHGRTPCGEYILNYAPVAAPQSDQPALGEPQITAEKLRDWYDRIHRYLENPSTPSGIPHDPPLMPGCTQEIWDALEYMDNKTFLRVEDLFSAITLAAPASQPSAAGADARGLAETCARQCLMTLKEHYDEWIAFQVGYEEMVPIVAALLESFRAETLEQAEDVAEEVWSRGKPGTEWDTASVAIMSGIRNLKSDPNWLARQIAQAQIEEHGEQCDCRYEDGEFHPCPRREELDRALSATKLGSGE